MGDRRTLPLDPALLRPGQVVADLVYHPLDTRAAAAAGGAAARTVDGLGMLVHQAVLQQELWTGRRPDAAVLRAAAEAELARRATARSTPSSDVAGARCASRRRRLGRRGRGR